MPKFGESQLFCSAKMHYTPDLFDNARIIQSCVGIPQPRYGPIAQNNPKTPSLFLPTVETQGCYTPHQLENEKKLHFGKTPVLQLPINVSNSGLHGTSVQDAILKNPSGTFIDTCHALDLCLPKIRPCHGSRYPLTEMPNPPNVSRSQGHAE